MTDLFATPERLRIPGADVVYHRGFLSEPAAAAMLRRLIDTIPWRQDDIVLWGRRIAQPRLTAWYGDPGRSYTYSGLTLEPLPWTDELQSLRRMSERVAEASFNSVLLNHYRDHNDSVGFHSDDEPELGATPTIASVSLGETRTLTFKPKKREDSESMRVALESGSLLVMKGDTQRNWRHAIAKESRPCGPRVNLTFRRILD
ncbi:MAG: alpha-ketoglutarate-dependent dioxygenase AlkB [Alphaproteobacteria bacterium]|nr:alpha-ketoglutarate-dependent dioxygenase AlkB [Alphaproteobacteria bacterium]MCW5744549.1 alpha-ketoglutarate-dependent dioxygenase AlkB [Alphaproteobacteria bacterium]